MKTDRLSGLLENIFTAEKTDVSGYVLHLRPNKSTDTHAFTRIVKAFNVTQRTEVNDSSLGATDGPVITCRF